MSFGAVASLAAFLSASIPALTFSMGWKLSNRTQSGRKRRDVRRHDQLQVTCADHDTLIPGHAFELRVHYRRVRVDPARLQLPVQTSKTAQPSDISDNSPNTACLRLFQALKLTVEALQVLARGTRNAGSKLRAEASRRSGMKKSTPLSWKVMYYLLIHVLLYDTI